MKRTEGPQSKFQAGGSDTRVPCRLTGHQQRRERPCSRHCSYRQRVSSLAFSKPLDWLTGRVGRTQQFLLIPTGGWNIAENLRLPEGATMVGGKHSEVEHFWVDSLVWGLNWSHSVTSGGPHSQERCGGQCGDSWALINSDLGIREQQHKVVLGERRALLQYQRSKRPVPEPTRASFTGQGSSW